MVRPLVCSAPTITNRPTTSHSQTRRWPSNRKRTPRAGLSVSVAARSTVPSSSSRIRQLAATAHALSCSPTLARPCSASASRPSTRHRSWRCAWTMLIPAWTASSPRQTFAALQPPTCTSADAMKSTFVCRNDAVSRPIRNNKSVVWDNDEMELSLMFLWSFITTNCIVWMNSNTRTISYILSKLIFFRLCCAWKWSVQSFQYICQINEITNMKSDLGCLIW